MGKVNGEDRIDSMDGIDVFRMKDVCINRQI